MITKRLCSRTHMDYKQTYQAFLHVFAGWQWVAIVNKRKFMCPMSTDFKFREHFVYIDRPS